MTAKQFIVKALITVFAILMVLVMVNYFIDIYGLFRPVKGRTISIYSDERTSKYLLAHRYVPENFEGYILGPSLSANLDPQIISSPRIYNLSMMGANITEQKAVVEKAIAHKPPAFVILCLHPYLTADHGMKTGMITPKEYYGALGSISLYKTYLLKFVRDNNLMPGKYPQHQFNEYGYNNYEVIVQQMPVEEKIKEQLEVGNAIDPFIDSTAWIEFNQMIELFDKKGIKVISYFHPLPRPLYEKYAEPLASFETKIRSTLEGRAMLIDFNAPEYTYFTKDLSNYIDHGHLSQKGQHYLLKEIVKLSGL